MFELTPRSGMAGAMAGQRKVLAEPTATVVIDMAGSWDVVTNRMGFHRLFLNSSGRLKKDLPWPLTNGVALLGSDGNPCLSLDYFLVNPRAKVYGCGYWNLRGNQYQNYVFFRRILDPLKMTRAERIQEMIDMAGEEYLLEKLAAEGGDFVHPRNLATMAAIMGLVASNPVGWFAGALAVLLGGVGLAMDWVTIQPLIKVFDDRANYSLTEADLREGAQAFAEIMAKLIANLVTGKVVDAAGRQIPLEKLKSAFLRKKPADWEQAAREAKAKGLDEAKPAGRGTGPLGLDVQVRGVKEQHHYSATQLTEGEFAGYRDISKLDGGGAIVLREPGAARAQHLEDGVISWSKMEAVKTKSLKGVLPEMLENFRGFLAIDIGDIDLKAARGRYVGEFDLAHIHSKFNGMGKRTMFELPRTAKVKGIANPQIFDEFYFVSVGGGKYLMVDKGMGIPILPDVDILAYAPIRNGKVSTASVDLLGKLRDKIPFFKRKAGKTDDLVQAHVMDETIRKRTKDAGFYSQTQHSESGGSRTYLDGEGRPKWNPSAKDLQERLIMFVQGRCLVFDNWHAYREFCLKNNMRHMCPWDF